MSSSTPKASSLMLLCLLVLVPLSLCHSIDKSLHRGEREGDGAFAPRGAQHHTDDQDRHDNQFDHESILGSSKDAEEYDHLPADESKRRLELLLHKMDDNKDQTIDTKEMFAWILRSFTMLSREESSEKFDEADEDNSGSVSWAEHLKETYDINELDDIANIEGDADTSRMLSEDKELFTAADKNADGVLDETEFISFSHPEEDDEMIPILVQHTMKEKDKNNDGKLSFAEYVDGHHASEQNEEGLLAEKDRFDEDYDKNLDGVLDLVEVRHWLVPDNRETATSETEHLFASADDNEDGVLDFEEVLGHHDLFVGSEVTDYGDHLHNLDRFDDEL